MNEQTSTRGADEPRGSRSACTAVLRKATEKVLDLGRLEPGMRVLDVGCGEGRVAYLSAPRVQPGGSVIGIDPSKTAIEAGRQIMSEAGLDNVDLRVGRPEELDLPDASVQVVFCQLGLERCQSPSAALAEMVRVLEPGGRLVLLSLGSKRKNEFLTLPHQLLAAASPDVASLDRYFEAGHAGDLEAELKAAGTIEAKSQALGVMLQVRNPESLWDMAASITGWTGADYERVSDELRRTIAEGGDCLRVSMELVLSMAIKPTSEAEAARPRSFDQVVTAVRPRIREMTAFEARRGVKGKKTVYLDVREPSERTSGVIAKSVHVPRGLLEARIDECVPDRDTALIVYSEDGRRSSLAALRLQELGFENVWNLVGGIRAWLRNGYSVTDAS